jgi:hypothetical protein
MPARALAVPLTSRMSGLSLEMSLFALRADVRKAEVARLQVAEVRSCSHVRLLEARCKQIWMKLLGRKKVRRTRRGAIRFGEKSNCGSLH